MVAAAVFRIAEHTITQAMVPAAPVYGVRTACSQAHNWKCIVGGCFAQTRIDEWNQSNKSCYGTTCNYGNTVDTSAGAQPGRS